MSDAPQGAFVVIPEISHSDISYIIKKPPTSFLSDAAVPRFSYSCFLFVPGPYAIAALLERGLGRECLSVVYKHFDFVVVLRTILAHGIDIGGRVLCLYGFILGSLLGRPAELVLNGITLGLQVFEQALTVLDLHLDFDVLLGSLGCPDNQFQILYVIGDVLVFCFLVGCLLRKGYDNFVACLEAGDFVILHSDFDAVYCYFLDRHTIFRRDLDRGAV